MRTVRLCVCLLLSATLLTLAGCKKAGFKSYDVGIKNCGATPDPVTVKEGDQVRWQPGDQHDYTIRFSHPSEPTGNPFTVKQGVSNPAHPIRGHSGCVPGGNGEFYCKYTVIRDNESTACADPGVHIIP